MGADNFEFFPFVVRGRTFFTTSSGATSYEETGNVTGPIMGTREIRKADGQVWLKQTGIEFQEDSRCNSLRTYLAEGVDNQENATWSDREGIKLTLAGSACTFDLGSFPTTTTSTTSTSTWTSTTPIAVFPVALASGVGTLKASRGADVGARAPSSVSAVLTSTSPAPPGLPASTALLTMFLSTVGALVPTSTTVAANTAPPNVVESPSSTEAPGTSRVSSTDHPPPFTDVPSSYRVTASIGLEFELPVDLDSLSQQEKLAIADSLQSGLHRGMCESVRASFEVYGSDPVAHCMRGGGSGAPTVSVDFHTHS